MGLQENCPRENVRQFLSVVRPFIFGGVFGSPHHCRLSRVKGQWAQLLKESLQYRLSMILREKSVTAEWYKAPPPLELGHVSSTGLLCPEVQGKSRFTSYHCYVKLPFTWVHSCSLAMYKKGKTYKTSFQNVQFYQGRSSSTVLLSVAAKLPKQRELGYNKIKHGVQSSLNQECSWNAI